MRRRVSIAATLAALLAVYLGVPCLALARAHQAIPREAPSAPCETSDAPGGAVLCEAPTAYAPITAGMPDVSADAFAPAPLPGATLDVAPRPAPELRDPALHGVAPPAFLLHRALLI